MLKHPRTLRQAEHWLTHLHTLVPPKSAPSCPSLGNATPTRKPVQAFACQHHRASLPSAHDTRSTLRGTLVLQCYSTSRSSPSSESDHSPPSSGTSRANQGQPEPHDLRNAVPRGRRLAARPSASSKTPPPPPSFRAFLQQALNFRALVSREGWRKLYQQSPEELMLAVVVLLALAGVGTYIVKLYFQYFNAAQFTRYPGPIANALRRALYFTNISPDAEQALKYYRKALELCDEHQLDPYSDDVLGIRIQVSAWLEKIGNYDGATTVLEGILADCLKWVREMEESMDKGTLPRSGIVAPASTTTPTPASTSNSPSIVASDVSSSASEDSSELLPPENLWRKRTRLLAKAVGISVKLGTLYSDEHVLQPQKAQKHLQWAVETALKELHRRQQTTSSTQPDSNTKSATVVGSPSPLPTTVAEEVEGPWMTADEIGGALEELGHLYEGKNRFDLALPLYFQALRLCSSPCHRALLMTNLASTFAQYPSILSSPPLSSPPPSDGQTPVVASFLALSPTDQQAMPKTVSEYRAAAMNWAKNARRHARDVPATDSADEGGPRTAECDTACAVALCTMADVAAMTGDVTRARKWYRECLALSSQLAFQPGLKNAKAGLERLNE